MIWLVEIQIRKKWYPHGPWWDTKRQTLTEIARLQQLYPEENYRATKYQPDSAGEKP